MSISPDTGPDLRLYEITLGCHPPERYFALFSERTETDEDVLERRALGIVALELGANIEDLEAICHTVRMSETPIPVFRSVYPLEDVIAVSTFRLGVKDER